MAIGSLDANEGPFLEIEVLGAYGQPHKLNCLIDTGFTGFLSIPILQAFPIGLILATTMPVVFANGQTEDKLVCLGVAKVDGAENIGLILIETKGNQILLGMEFLKKFAFKLIVCPTTGQVEVVETKSGFTVTAAKSAPHHPPPSPPPADTTAES